ncbi:GNAT family N-acetyltransferase [Cetobacterium sp. SF1]|uniref:GNAT family N-acetyltransferase n=1 Tax=Cetobacterium sp. SF1 TaxID=3417654 RepID=UPI003CE7ABD7
MIILRKTTLEDIPKLYKNLHLHYVEKYCKNELEKQWHLHEKWYSFLIHSPNYLLYTIEDTRGEFMGSIKFELQEEIAIISIFLVPKVRNKGYSKILINASVEELKFEHPEISLVLAYILEENENSKKAFKSSGFIYEGIEEYTGVDHLLYIKIINKIEK